VQQRAQRGDHHAATAELHAAGGRDRQYVERGEIARDAARHRDEARDDQRVAGQLDVDHPSEPLRPFQRERPEDVQRIRRADEQEQGLARKRAGRRQLDEDRRAKEERADADANGNQPEEFATNVALRHARPYPASWLIRSKIGRYIAMTMPPTTPPRNAIMSGSSSVSRPATAVSTSSS